MFLYLLDKDCKIIDEIKDNCLYEYSELCIKSFIEEIDKLEYDE